MDITKMPVLEGVLGFFVVVLILTFVAAFSVTGGDGEEGGEPAASEAPQGTPAPDGSELAVSMGDNFFEPDQYLVAEGASVNFFITNDGNAIHNMRIAGPDGSYNSHDDAVSDPDQMSGGETGTLEWTAPAEAGEIDFQCDFHPGTMVGTITVQAAAEPAESGGSPSP